MNSSELGVLNSENIHEFNTKFTNIIIPHMIYFIILFLYHVYVCCLNKKLLLFYQF